MASTEFNIGNTNKEINELAAHLGNIDTFEDVSSWFQNIGPINYAIKIGHIVFYSSYIGSITSAANTIYQIQNVIKSDHPPTYTSMCSVFPSQDSYPMVDITINNSGTLSIRHGSAALSNYAYTITGYLIYS